MAKAKDLPPKGAICPMPAPLPAESPEVFVFPASFAQQRLWFLDQLAPGNPYYNVSAAVRLTGNLNLVALEQTFNEIVRRHEALRTNFEMVEGQLNQLIAPSSRVHLPIVDLRSLPVSEREAAARARAIAVAQRPFDLTAGSLFRVEVLQLDGSDCILLLNLHHIVADGWSMGVLIRELGTLYSAFSMGKPSPLPELPIQYADFAHWQREWLQGEVLLSQMSYWRRTLADLTVLNFPTDRLRPGVHSYQGATQLLELSQDLTESLYSLSQQSGVTLFMTLLAALATLLHRYTGQEDIVVGSPIANRNRSELEGLIGFFVNSLVLRTDLSGNPTFRELLARVREVALGAYAHQDLPFEKLVQELQPERDLSRHPLFQVAIALQNTPVEALELPGLTLSLFEFESGSARLDLEFHLWETPEGLKGQVIYSTALFDGSTITRMLGHFQTLLEGIVTTPDRRLADLPILTVAEQQQLLVEWNQTQQDYPLNQCFHQLFEQRAKLNPEAIAVVLEDEQLTYQELNCRSNKIAHYLQKLGVAPEVLVGICVERSLEMVVGVLGILKAGGAYVTLDPTYPPERLRFMIEDARLSILLTQQSLAPLVSRLLPGKEEVWGAGRVSCTSSDPPNPLKKGEPEFIVAHGGNPTVVCLDSLGCAIAQGVAPKAIAQESQENPISGVTAANLAYIIYTSGSTGKPKGVLIEHRGVCNLAEAQIQAFDLKPNSRILQFASLSFDASIFEIVMALRVGATLYLAPKEGLLGAALVERLQDNAITHVTLPPSVLKTLPAKELPALKVVISAGEACPPDVVARWASDHRFFNAYGLTETTVWSTLAEVHDASRKPTLGRAIANTQVYVLDAHLQPLPIGIPGELYISSEGLARGYLNRPDLTSERFIPNPFAEERRGGEGERGRWGDGANFPPSLLTPSDRLYKTGDLACWQAGGDLEFLGRIDHQVKIRGYRIELGEIETLLSQHPLVQEAVVFAREDISGNKQLVAYVVGQASPSDRTIISPSPPLPLSPSPSDLRRFLKEKLPDYMVPSAFVVLSCLPLTPSGKVDRSSLPLAITDNLSRVSTFTAPRTQTEAALAKLWAQLLNLEQVGVHDNFFELGGDSLLAIRLIQEVHQQFEQELPLSDLFLAPTVEQLALLLQKNDVNAPSQGTNLLWSPLVPLQSRGLKPPLFFVHPIFGVVLPYYELAAHLGYEQPFYGLQPFGLDGKHPPLTRIEDMASHYIEALRRVQPQGPYQLGGWSFGGLVAFEMATQLHRAGQQVSFLALLDTSAPVSSNQLSFSDGCKFLLTTVARSIYPFLIDYWSLMTTQKHPRAWLSSLKRATITNLIPQETRLRLLDELTLHRILRVFYANSRATLNYVPQAYSNPITLFRTYEPSRKSPDPTLGWSQLATVGVEVNQVPGNHLTMLRKPHVQVLAAQLRGYLDRHGRSHQ